MCSRPSQSRKKFKGAAFERTSSIEKSASGVPNIFIASVPKFLCHVLKQIPVGTRKRVFINYSVTRKIQAPQIRRAHGQFSCGAYYVSVPDFATPVNGNSSKKLLFASKETTKLFCFSWFVLQFLLALTYGNVKALDKKI